MAHVPLRSRMPAFWEHIPHGLSPGDAGAAVGVSSGLRPRLTLEERIEIQAGVHAGESLRSMARRLDLRGDARRHGRGRTAP